MGRKGIAIMLDERKEEAFCTILREELQLATGCTCPPNFPVCVCGKKPTVRLVNRKPIVCGPAELTYNPRARSAKLRVAEKL